MSGFLAIFIGLGLGCGAGGEGGELAPGPAAAADLPAPVPEAGSRREIPDHLRRFFTDDEFARMGDPMPGDWLTEFHESGQSFPSWRRSRPNMPTGERRTIYIQPMTLTEEAPLPELVEAAALYFGLPVRVLPDAPMAHVGATDRRNEYTGEPQVLVPDVLEWLKPRVPDDAYAVIGLTSIDLYPDPSWNFVFGVGSFRERVGIYSLARYHPSFHDRHMDDDHARLLVLRRAVKVMLHELGHMFGMAHCTFFECVMNGSNSLAEADRRPLYLCPAELRKLHHAVGFDLRARYLALSLFYRRVGLVGDAEWTEERAAVAATPAPADTEARR